MWPIVFVQGLRAPKAQRDQEPPGDTWIPGEVQLSHSGGDDEVRAGKSVFCLSTGSSEIPIVVKDGCCDVVDAVVDGPQALGRKRCVLFLELERRGMKTQLQTTFSTTFSDSVIVSSARH